MSHEPASASSDAMIGYLEEKLIARARFNVALDDERVAVIQLCEKVPQVWMTYGGECD